MIVKIDDRPAANGPIPFYAIRLYPETNEEMALLERPIVIKYVPKEFIRNSSDKIHYAIIFQSNDA